MNRSSLERAQEFLAHEAHLLDSWQLREWADLFTEDGVYLVPPLTEPEGNPARTLFLIYDDFERIRERAKRLLKTTAHAEFPRSITTRLTSNIRLTPGQDGEMTVDASFVVYRVRGSKFDVLPGRSRHVLVWPEQGELRIRSKRAMLGLEVLRPQDKLTIIL
jgi:p-cumate 2,3-dioxygenase beta subunit